MYFPKGLDSFGVVLKGASVTRLPEVSGEFDHLFIVNNIDRNIDNKNSEWDVIAPNIEGKEVAHFVNRLPTATLLKKHYEQLGVKEVQFTKSELDFDLKGMKRIYESFGLNCNLLPSELLEYNKYFGPEYARKHPNTGLLAIIYAAHILKPKNLYVVGLDFYQNDYLYRRPWQAPLEQQQAKMQRTDMVGHFVDVVKKNSKVNFKLITNADVPKVKNLEIL